MGIYTVEFPKAGSFAPPEDGFPMAADPREVHIQVFICDDAQTPHAKEISYREYQRQVAEAKSNPGLAISRVMWKVDNGLIEETRTDPTALMGDAVKDAAKKMLEEMIREGKIKLVE